MASTHSRLALSSWARVRHACAQRHLSSPSMTSSPLLSALRHSPFSSPVSSCPRFLSTTTMHSHLRSHTQNRDVGNLPLHSSPTRATALHRSHMSSSSSYSSPTLPPLTKSDVKKLSLIEKKVTWLSSYMIHHANNVRAKRDGLKVGGHQVPQPLYPY